jgi:hypothetical protein
MVELKHRECIKIELVFTDDLDDTEDNSNQYKLVGVDATLYKKFEGHAIVEELVYIYLYGNIYIYWIVYTIVQPVVIEYNQESYEKQRFNPTYSAVAGFFFFFLPVYSLFRFRYLC